MYPFSIYHYLVLITLGFCSNSQAAEQPFIEVVTSNLFPVSNSRVLQRQGYSINVYKLDDGKRLVTQIGANLPHNQEAAKNALQQRFKKMGEEQVKAQIMHAFQAITISTQYGLTHYPAVVFNHGESVVYGVTNLIQALSFYQQWKAK